jgi:hypothetical protein
MKGKFEPAIPQSRAVADWVLRPHRSCAVDPIRQAQGLARRFPDHSRAVLVMARFAPPAFAGPMVVCAAHILPRRSLRRTCTRVRLRSGGSQCCGGVSGPEAARVVGSFRTAGSQCSGEFPNRRRPVLRGVCSSRICGTNGCLTRTRARLRTSK